MPIKLEQNKVDILLSKANKKETLVIDLENQSIIQENGEFYKFEVDKFRKKCLLEGLDDIALTLEKSKNINEYEDKIRNLTPWISE